MLGLARFDSILMIGKIIRPACQLQTGPSELCTSNKFEFVILIQTSRESCLAGQLVSWAKDFAPSPS